MCRPWREVAVELQNEKDQHKVIALAKELAKALDEQAHTKPSAQVNGQTRKASARRQETNVDCQLVINFAITPNSPG